MLVEGEEFPEVDADEWSSEPPEGYDDVEQIKALMPKPYVKRATKKRICVFDTETDPFAEDRIVRPFCVGFYDGECYVDFWGDDCIQQFFAHLAEHYAGEDLLIYAHNFGGFDCFFQLDYLDHDQQPFIIGGKIVSAMFAGQEFRDSYRIIPTPLRSYKKTDIDYALMERDVRHLHKREILDYLKDDCVYLYELVAAFHDKYGDRLTIGSAGLPILNSFHPFRLMGEDMDRLIRPYYYGGRTQCFEVGIFEGRFFIYDVNSMYPWAMRDLRHPIGSSYSVARDISDDTAFVCVDGWSGGAFPVRQEDGGLDFPLGYGRFFVSIYEYRAAIETGAFSLDRIIHARDCSEWGDFADFVNFYYNDRLDARAQGDDIRALFDKFFLNVPYGKFAQNPERYETYELRHAENPPPFEELKVPCLNNECVVSGHKKKECSERGWYPHTTNGDTIIWARKSTTAWRSYKNVGIAASITGGARSALLRGIRSADRPMYCDTDSLICEAFHGPVDGKQLGAWKLEATGDVVAIAGKKMYVVLTYDLDFDDTKEKAEFATYNGRKMRVVKKASKGVRLTADEILRVCRGEVVLYKNPVPKFQLDGTADFINREVRRTGNASS